MSSLVHPCVSRPPADHSCPISAPQERCSSPADWRSALLALSTAQPAAEDSNGQQPALAALLDHLASALPPDQLRQALAETADQHSACLQRCHSVQRADVVRAEIMRMA